MISKKHVPARIMILEVQATGLPVISSYHADIPAAVHDVVVQVGKLEEICDVLCEVKLHG